MSSDLQVDRHQKGIWQYHFYYPPILEQFRLSLGEGGTPQMVFGGIVFKREDKNPTGSLKDRGMAYQISQAYQEGAKNLVISTSGNAGISAAAYCQLAKIRLHVFISPKIDQLKMEKIRQLGAKINLTKRPVSEAMKFSQAMGFSNLRPSTQANGTAGYRSLAFELHQSLGKVENLFLPVSSGTALVGMAEGFKILGYLPRFHLVQTTTVCPLAGLFDRDYQKGEKSLAEALVARVTPRKEQVLNLVADSGGGGWVISDRQIRQAWEELTKWGIQTSAEGAAALAAIRKAQRKGEKLEGEIVCLLTGRKYD